MFRRREGFAAKLTWLVLRLALWGSWAFGLFPFTFDPQARQLRRHSWFLAYGVAINSLLMCLVVVSSFYSAETVQNLEIFKRNQLLEWIDVLIGILALIASCGTHFITFWKNGQVLRILNELLVLEHRHFWCLDVQDASKFNFYVIQKGMCVVGAVLSVLVVSFGVPELYTSSLFLVILCLMEFCVHLVVMHFLLAILCIYRYVWLINRQLLAVVSRLRVDPRSDTSRIRLLLSLYGRLLALSNELEATFEGQITLILASGLAGNIVIIYFLIVYTVSLGQLSMPLIIFPFSLAMNVWDYWLSISVCDLTERTGRRTSTILKLFSDLEHTDVHLERSMIVATFTYLLCLVQFDFMNL
ncbi:putative gustatory receptor 22b [Drosophila obscura]|uniref:putative gustatory receptor 22b n=1 Tax=Drosophila obscura TaxID=7282 RepID=UPI001BB29E7F|nr:putative gustatory receptor 22b [Drosophila obscura]